MNLGGAELLILVGIAVLIFGAGWLPKAARNLGKAKVEFDEVQRQFNEAKDSVVEQSGVKELEATMRKANQVMKASPQKLMKDAAKSAVVGGASKATGDTGDTDDDTTGEDARGSDDEIEDAEIIERTDGVQDTPETGGRDQPGDRDTNINVDFT